MNVKSTQILFDRTSTSNVEYIGFAGSGIATTSPQWKIMKVENDGNGNTLSIKYALGTETAVNKWSERTTLAYS